MGSNIFQSRTENIEKYPLNAGNKTVKNSNKSNSATSILLPPISKHKEKTILIRLENILVSITSSPSPTYDFTIKIDNTTYYVQKRMGIYLLFWELIMNKFEIVIYTSANKEYAGAILEGLQLNLAISNRLYRQSSPECASKDLSKLGRYLKKVIILDHHSPDSCKLYQENVFELKPFYGDVNDREILKFVEFVKKKAACEDIREAIEENNREAPIETEKERALPRSKEAAIRVSKAGLKPKQVTVVTQSPKTSDNKVSRQSKLSVIRKVSKEPIVSKERTISTYPKVPNDKNRVSKEVRFSVVPGFVKESMNSATEVVGASNVSRVHKKKQEVGKLYMVPEDSEMIYDEDMNLSRESESDLQGNYLARGKKTIVIDLENTLVKTTLSPFALPCHDFTISLPSLPVTCYVLKRPGVDELFGKLARNYEVVVFTECVEEYADAILDRLDPNYDIEKRLYRNSCKDIGEDIVKDLRVLGQDLRTVMIVDDEPSSYKLQPMNAVPIKPFDGNLGDRELYKLMKFCEAATTYGDVRNAIKANLSNF